MQKKSLTFTIIEQFGIEIDMLDIILTEYSVTIVYRLLSALMTTWVAADLTDILL